MSMRRTDKKYNMLLDYIRSRGIHVHHIRMPDDTYGLYDPATDLIEINREIKGTVTGCFALLHELGHKISKDENFFPRFMAGFTKYHWRYMEEAERAEIYASTFAVRFMAKIGLKYTPKELTKEGLPEMREIWRELYFTN